MPPRTTSRTWGLGGRAAASGVRNEHTSFRWWIPVNIRLAWRNLARDRVRLAISVVGVGFSVFLMTVQLGLLIGFATTSSSLIDRSDADFWVAPKGTRDVDQTGQIPYRVRYEAESALGSAAAAPLNVSFAYWKTLSGSTETVIVVGIDPEHPGVEPWQIVDGDAGNLRFPDGIIIDRLYAQKLGITRVGQTVEINDQRARVVAMTSGVRTFTQSPYVFASFKTASRLAAIPLDRASYVLVRSAPGADRGKVQKELQARFPDDDVWTKVGFSWQTRIYWLFSTGAGTALCIAAFLGLIVGIVIVAQTLYAATIERLSEYATLRALGATDKFIRTVILRQALTIAVVGYLAGTFCALVAVIAAANASPALTLPWWLGLGLFIVTAAMCSGASLLSIRKVLTLEPATVFR